MKYYAIVNGTEVTSSSAETLIKFYGDAKELPEDYEIGKYIVEGNELVLNPHWEEEQANLREQEFTSDFFEIPSYGWYRKKPKGYSSAVESLNTAFNAVTVMQQLPEGMLIFYQQPDFTKPEQCTEQWLVEHQSFNEVMTAQEFGQFYVQFVTAWNNQEHMKEVGNDTEV